MLQSVCWSGYVRWRVNNPQRTFRRRRGSIHRARFTPNNYKLLCAPVRKHTLDKTK